MLERERSGALRIALIYALVGGLWILFSDHLLWLMVPEPRLFTRLATYKGWLFILVTALLLNWLIHRYLLAIRTKDENIKKALQAVAEATGEKFFASLVRHLAGLLQADYVLIGEFVPDDHHTVRTIAAFGKGHEMENFSYSLEGTPCAAVFESGAVSCFFPDNVAKQFPDDHLLDAMGIKAYVGQPLRNSSGRTTGLIVGLSCRPMQDRTSAESLLQLFAVRAAGELERRQSELALRESEGRFRQLVKHSPVPIVIIDPDSGEIEYRNRKFSETFGFTAEEIPTLEEWWLRAYPDTDYRRHLKELWDDTLANARMSGMEIGPLEAHVACANGAHRIVEIFAAPVSGKVMVVFLEVTERKQAEDAIKGQFEQISTIFDSLNALVYVADLDTNELLYMNKYGSRMTADDWRGKKCFDILHGREQPCTYCTNDRLVKDGVPQPDCTWEFQSDTGRWYQCIDRAIAWTDGRLVRLEIAIDITERKGMEKMKDEIISAVSHEMRTPLTAIMGFTEFLLDTGVDPEEGRACLTTIYSETRRLHELISNFLDLQQLKARLSTYHFRELQVLPLLQDAASLFMHDQQHRIRIDCPEDLPPLWGDEGKIHQVLTNLLSNAVKYSTKESLVTVGARREASEITIWVRDEGVGIPAELRERIFERLYRLDNTDRRKVGGAGLGLTIVRELVEGHGGRVRVESVPGKGSTFFVTFPIGSPVGVNGGKGRQSGK